MEVRALREQLALDADTILNFENLLQLAREGSDGAAGSSGLFSNSSTQYAFTKYSPTYPEWLIWNSCGWSKRAACRWRSHIYQYCCIEASTALKDLERTLERSGLIGRREEANCKELEALRVRNRELVTELEQLRNAQDNNQFKLYCFENVW